MGFEKLGVKKLGVEEPVFLVRKIFLGTSLGMAHPDSMGNTTWNLCGISCAEGGSGQGGQQWFHGPPTIQWLLFRWTPFHCGTLVVHHLIGGLFVGHRLGTVVHVSLRVP